MKILITDHYDNYAISVGTDDYSTEPTIVGKGVLLGDCLSPLSFSMIVNTLTKLIDHEKVVRVIVLVRLYFHVTGFNLVMLRLSQHRLKKIGAIHK